MLRLANIVDTAINPALAMLPRAMDTSEARIQLLATGLQESRFEHRYQIVNGGGKGPARSFWQMERGGGCTGVVKHSAVRALTKWMCEQRGCAFTPAAIWQAIETDDVLAAALARLLYWTDAAKLPAIGDADGAWAYYLRVWRPGKPHPETWPALYAQAVNERDWSLTMRLAYDKKLHLAAGAIVAWAAYMLAQPGLVLEPLLALLQVERGTLAALAALAAGLAKEGFDWFNQKTHTVDPMDAVATFFPGLLVFVGDWAFYHLTIPEGLV